MNSRNRNFQVLLMSLACSTIAAHLFLWKSSQFSSTCPSFQAPKQPVLQVYIAKLPREFNFGLLESYCKGKNENHEDKYPDDPLFKQHSAEFWLLSDLENSQNPEVLVTENSSQADVVFVPFFAALSAQLQLRGNKSGNFRKKHVEKNRDYERQRRVVDLVKGTREWERSGGRDHVFVLADPMAMWHVRHEITDSIFLVVDFGGWYKEDAKSNISKVIQHNQVSLIKDVVVPHTHLLPSLHLSQNRARNILLYFRGARHRHRGGLVREKLWNILQDEPDVVLETGLPDSNGLQEATKGMRSSEFCLNPAGDTPSSCRLYDAIASLCIPVIVSDDIVLPFEGILDYRSFSIFVSTRDALRPGFLVNILRNMTRHEKMAMRKQLSRVQTHFEYDRIFIPEDRNTEGAVSLTWRKIMSKVPLVKESVARYRRNSLEVATIRCHCVS